MESYTQQITKACLLPLTPYAAYTTCTSNPVSPDLLVMENKTWWSVTSEHLKWAIHLDGSLKQLGQNLSCKSVNGPQITVTQLMINNNTSF